MSEPYYDIGELISRLAELEKNVKSGNTEIFFEKQSVEQKGNSVVNEVIAPINLLSVWNEIVEEIIKKHPLTAEPLKRVVIKVFDDLSVQLIVSGQLDYESVVEFKEQISKLFQRETNLNITIKIILASNSFTEVQDDEYKDTFRTEVPKHIEEIAKKFGSVAKKI
jgi:DNA polymerase-3 subunit gamma/tau